MRTALAILLIGAVASARDGSGPPNRPRIRGTVTVKAGLVPRARSVVLPSGCGAAAGARITMEHVVADTENHLAGALVYVAQGAENVKIAPPPGKAVLQVKDHRFAPHLLALRIGQELVFRNDDDHPVNVHGLPFSNPELNVSLPRKDSTFSRTFAVPEIAFKVKDDCHAWMSAWIAVLPHPLFAVTDAAGKFEIADLPAGKYVLEVWHPKYKSVAADLNYAGRSSVTRDFELSERKE